MWTVQVAENPGDLQGEPTVSFAGFRVDEVLNNIGDFTAVGRTARVSGSIELSDTSLVAATVEVQMGTLQTDSSFRDGRIYQALSTSEFPLAVFTLVQPVELPAGMAGGEPFSGYSRRRSDHQGCHQPGSPSICKPNSWATLIVAVGSSDGPLQRLRRHCPDRAHSRLGRGQRHHGVPTALHPLRGRQGGVLSRAWTMK